MDERKTTKKGLLLGLLCLIILLLVLVIGMLVVLLQKKDGKETTSEAVNTSEVIKETSLQEMEREKDHTSDETTEAEKEKQDTSGISEEELTKETLDSGELKEVENNLNSMTNYGFLQSEYSDYRNINWNMVFYSGAGISENVTDDMVKAYLSYLHQDEQYTDIAAVRGKNLETFVKNTTGHPYKDALRPLEWVYLSEYDMYMCEHGDTNYCEVTVLDGEKEGNRYTVRYVGYNESYEQSTMEVVFQKTDSGYRFISNRCVKVH